MPEVKPKQFFTLQIKIIFSLILIILTMIALFVFYTMLREIFREIVIFILGFSLGFLFKLILSFKKEVLEAPKENKRESEPNNKV